ncbi:MAG: amidohydrolase, partial [SAR202 cluster bacterium]|nr:amidohydrolase [SAR202 cluster bacterium]
DWIADFCASHPDRLAGAGVISLEDIGLAVQQLRLVARKGLRTGAITHAPPEDQPYSHPRYEPFWAAAEEIGIPISLHAVTAARRRRMQSQEFMVFYPSAVVDIQYSLSHIIVSGVLERHPRLKLVSVENDIGWVGTYLARIDHAYERHRHWTGSGKRLPARPSEYFRRGVSLTFQFDKPGVETRHHVGVDNIMWASDYPHSDTTWPRSREFIQWQFGDLPEVERHKIICGNAAKLYSFEVLG